MHELEIWVLVDENGNYVVTTDSGDLEEQYDNAVGEGSGVDRRTIKLILYVPKLQVTVLTGEVPDLTSTGKLTVVPEVAP